MDMVFGMTVTAEAEVIKADASVELAENEETQE